MKLMGCGMVFLCGLLTGLFHRQKLEEKVRDWQELLHFFQLIREELESSLRPSTEILQNISEQCKNCRFLRNYFEAEGGVQQRLLYAAEQLSDPKQRNIAMRFAGRFGTASADIQLEAIAALERACLDELNSSKELSQKEGSLSVHLGMLIGAAAAILLL